MRILLNEEPSRIVFQVPLWAFIPDDEFGKQNALLENVSCKTCNRVQSHKNAVCVYCCKHEILKLTTKRLECRSLDIYIDILAVVCEKCGKHYVRDEWNELFGRRIVNLECELNFANKIIADAREYIEEHEEIFGDEGLREILNRKER